MARTKPREWGEWIRCTTFTDREGVTHEFDASTEVYRNLIYTVQINRVKTPELTAMWPDVPGMIYLSIKRNDRKVIRDWRHFQRIKNELVGEDCEAVELYPAEDRLVDEANQFHLWCLPFGLRFPFGFDEGRLIATEDEAARLGARQRPFD